jgi:hypothetical protein
MLIYHICSSYKTDEQTNGRTNKPTDEQTKEYKMITQKKERKTNDYNRLWKERKKGRKKV